METYTLAWDKVGRAQDIADWSNGLRGAIVHDGERQMIVENVLQLQVIPTQPGVASALALVEVKNFV